MILLCGVAVLLLAHAYAGYPLSLLALATAGWRRGASKPTPVRATGPPTVALVISAYNEEACMEAKIANTLALDYPRHRLRVIVVSDGSTDRTEAIVRAHGAEGIELAALPGRRGKVACLNQVIPGLDTDLVVMSDANSMYRPDAVRRLAAHFDAPEIGCVCGRLSYVNPREEAAGEGEAVYWGYEDVIKRLESRIGSLLGANGSIYGYRRELFRAVDPLTFCDDVIPIRVAISGRRVIYDPDARCTEEASPERVELRRRRRHASFGMRSMLLVIGEAASSGRWFVVYQCVSHRVLRWLGGPAIATIILATPFLPDPWRTASAAVLALFGALALAGWLLDRQGLRLRPAYLAFYLLAIHAAGLTGLVRFLLGGDRPFWEPRQ